MSVLLKKALLLLVLTAGVVAFALEGELSNSTDEAGLEMRLPFVLSQWYGKKSEAGPAEKKLLPPDTEIEKMIYHPRTADVDALQTTIVLSGKDRTSIHRPEVCLTAQGWDIHTSRSENVELDNGESIQTRILEISREVEGEDRVLHGQYTYWFVGSETTTHDHLVRILSTATANFIEQKNPRWAYVSVLSVGTKKDSTQKWVREAVPQFQNVFHPASIF